MEDQAIEQVRWYYIRAWEKTEVKGQVFFALREVTSPERQALLRNMLVRLRLSSEPIWTFSGLIFNCETMTTKKRDDIFDIEWLWYSLDFGENWLKSFLKLQNRFLLHTQLRKSWLVKILFWSSNSDWETKNRAGKKPEVNSYHVLGIHNPLFLGLQPWKICRIQSKKRKKGQRDVLNFKWKTMRSLSV